ISLVKSWEASKLQNFLVSLILNRYSSFLFGWNVHEKQSYYNLTYLIMYIFQFDISKYTLFRSYIILTVSGLYSLFPLLF
ncbi:hypothetical protein RhiirA5_253459, partial [Rhizophagus irregularis]